MIIRPAIREDIGTVTGWLVSAGLPTADLTDAHMEHFLVAVINNSPVGMIGLEPFARTGLLRSLVVDPSARNSGIGRQLVTALETRAATQGIEDLWLLTIDADAFFTGLGYEEVKRDRAPADIRSTTEFSKLCPGNAVLMRKSL